MIRANKWPNVAIGDLANLVNGYGFEPSDWQGTPDDGAIPIIRIQNLNNNDAPFNYTTNIVSERYIVNSGDLLFSWSGSRGTSFGPHLWQRGKGILNQHIFNVHHNERIDRRYFYWALKNAVTEIEEKAHGGVGLVHITKSALEDVRLILPPLPEQKRIAAILDSADAIRQKRKAAIAKLDELAQSVFLEMFGDPVKNEKGWDESKHLGELADIVSGITKGRKLNGTKAREVPYLAVSNVQDRHLDLSHVKTIEATNDEIERYRLEEDDLLLTEGGDPDKLGRGTLWSNKINECIHQNHIFRVRITDRKVINPVFLEWLIGSTRGKGYFLKSAKQTTGIASINMGQLKNFPMILPPISVQNEFANAMSRIALLVETSEVSRSKTEMLFRSLQHRAFAGEL